MNIVKTSSTKDICIDISKASILKDAFKEFLCGADVEVSFAPLFTEDGKDFRFIVSSTSPTCLLVRSNSLVFNVNFLCDELTK